MKTRYAMRRWIQLCVLCLLLLGGISVPPSALGAPSSYEVVVWTVDSGGLAGARSGGDSTVYVLGGTIGQYDAGRLISDTLTLDGGFWPVVAALAPRRVYLPCILRLG